MYSEVIWAVTFQMAKEKKESWCRQESTLRPLAWAVDDLPLRYDTHWQPFPLFPFFQTNVQYVLYIWVYTWQRVHYTACMYIYIHIYVYNVHYTAWCHIIMVSSNNCPKLNGSFQHSQWYRSCWDCRMSQVLPSIPNQPQFGKSACLFQTHVCQLIINWITIHT